MSATHVYGGVQQFSYDVYLRRSLSEPVLLAGIKRELSTAEVSDEVQQRLRRRLKSTRVPTAASERTHAAKLEREVAALVDAIASGRCVVRPRWRNAYRRPRRRSRA